MAESAQAYCSWCFERTTHDPDGQNVLRRKVFKCLGCGGRTLVCSAPKCREMARGEGKVDDLYCAAHAGKIAGFGRLTQRLDQIDDYRVLFKREVVNLGKMTKIAGAAVGGGLIVGPAAFIAATKDRKRTSMPSPRTIQLA